VIPDRQQAIRTALISAQKNDVILLAGKWDEHMLITNIGPVNYHEKTFVQEVLREIESNNLVK
jgi:UDP-N-acetylmuramyl tripeptide synthase